MTLPRRDPSPPAHARSDTSDRPAFLGTHRAIGVCAREFTLLAKELVAAVTTLAAHSDYGKPIVRQSPDRCVLQVGDVALTVTWLRNGSDFPQHGQLLGIIWRGVIAPRGEYSAERKSTRRIPVAPVSEWEETLSPTADCADSWRWQSDTVAPSGFTPNGFTSAQLAARFIERLRLAYPLDGSTMPEAVSA